MKNATCCTVEDLSALAEARGDDPNNVYDALRDARLLLKRGFGLNLSKSKKLFYRELEDGRSIEIASPCIHGFEIEPFIFIMFEVNKNGTINIAFEDDEVVEHYVHGNVELRSAMDFYGIGLKLDKDKKPIGFEVKA